MPTPPPSRPASVVGAVVKLKCPRCRIGRLFPTSSFGFAGAFDMPRRCPTCALDYWPEPGFYYGAMFVGYIIFSFPFLGFVFLLHWVFDWSLGASMLTLCLVAAVGFVYIFRVARSIWINVNVDYDEALSDRLLREARKAAAA